MVLCLSYLVETDLLIYLLKTEVVSRTLVGLALDWQGELLAQRLVALKAE